MVTSGTVWPVMEGKSTHDVTWPSLHRNANNCKMAFEDDFTSNMAINLDIVPMRRLSRSKARAEVELIAEVCKDLGMDKMRLSMILEYFELGLLDCEHVKIPIPNIDCENNHVSNESESHKDRDKKGCKD